MLCYVITNISFYPSTIHTQKHYFHFNTERSSASSSHNIPYPNVLVVSVQSAPANFFAMQDLSANFFCTSTLMQSKVGWVLLKKMFQWYKSLITKNSFWMYLMLLMKLINQTTDSCENIATRLVQWCDSIRKDIQQKPSLQPTIKPLL